MNQTLYIRKDNWEKFKDEPQKSELVNLLLARHYDYFKPGTLIEELPDEDQELHKDAIVGNADLREHLDRNFDVCEHGAGQKMCRDSKCRNYQFK